MMDVCECCKVSQAAALLLENQHCPCFDRPSNPLGPALPRQESSEKSIGLQEDLCASFHLSPKSVLHFCWFSLLVVNAGS